MPPVGACFIVCIDGNKNAIVIVVNVSTPNYFRAVVALVDGHDDKGQHVPLQTGNQFGVKDGVPDVTSFPEGTVGAQVEWVLSDGCIINTPAWPSLAQKVMFKVVPGVVNA